MSRGEFLTRVTIWLALGSAALGVGLQFAARTNPIQQTRARWAWTIGGLSLLAHVACAYHFYHGWSQTLAYQETARQTAEIFNFNWGGGIYVNYVFVAFWLLDVLWWWRGVDVYSQRPRVWVWVWQSFFLFIVFNATVVFKDGAQRWIGLVMCAAMAAIWWLIHKSSSKGIHA